MSFPSETKVTVIAILTARPGKEDELRALLMALIEPTRKEAGCLNYDLHELPGRPGRFMFHENWESQAHLDAHFQSVHLTSALRRLDELTVEAPTIEIWRQIG